MDCIPFDKSINWFYPAGNELRPCLENCKACTSSTTCSGCFDLSDPSKTLKVDTRVDGQVKCSEAKKCKLEDKEYQINDFECLKCERNTYLLDEMNPPQCGACDKKMAQWVDTETKRCLQCPSGQFLVDGVSPTTCDTCLQKDGMWREPGTRICHKCPRGCKECLSGTKCLGCLAASNFLGTDELIS